MRPSENCKAPMAGVAAKFCGETEQELREARVGRVGRAARSERELREARVRRVGRAAAERELQGPDGGGRVFFRGR